jgi:hypothetical protein
MSETDATSEKGVYVSHALILDSPLQAETIRSPTMYRLLEV